MIFIGNYSCRVGLRFLTSLRVLFGPRFEILKASKANLETFLRHFFFIYFKEN